MTLDAKTVERRQECLLLRFSLLGPSQRFPYRSMLKYRTSTAVPLGISPRHSEEQPGLMLWLVVFLPCSEELRTSQRTFHTRKNTVWANVIQSHKYIKCSSRGTWCRGYSGATSPTDRSGTEGPPHAVFEGETCERPIPSETIIPVIIRMYNFHDGTEWLKPTIVKSAYGLVVENFYG